MKRALAVTALIILAALAASPLLAHAQVTGVSDVVRVLNKLATWLFIVLVGVAIVFFILAGFRYLSASGNAAKLAEANQIIFYGVISLALGLVAKGIVFLVDEVIR